MTYPTPGGYNGKGRAIRTGLKRSRGREMSDRKEYSSYAIMHELNKREFRKKLGLFPEELRYYVILANSIIGAENAKRVAGTPEAVVRDGEEFVGKLLAMVDPERDDSFKTVLETYLIETMREELRCCCPNCRHFDECLGPDGLEVGGLFERRVNGEETEELKKEITCLIDAALAHTPYVDGGAERLCGKFIHQYSAAEIGEVFGRYADIAATLQKSYGMDYRKIQQQMVSLNMEFCEKDSGPKRG